MAANSSEMEEIVISSDGEEDQPTQQSRLPSEAAATNQEYQRLIVHYLSGRGGSSSSWSIVTAARQEWRNAGCRSAFAKSDEAPAGSVLTTAETAARHRGCFDGELAKISVE